MITQLQTSGDQSIYGKNQRFDLEFNHPVKELVWVVKGTENRHKPQRSYSMRSNKIQYDCPETEILSTASTMVEITDAKAKINPVKTSQLVLNGHERFSKRHGLYFDSAQVYQHHTQSWNTIGINVYSFALKPEESQPTGSCNFSRIDNAVLDLEFNEYESQKADYFKDSCIEVFATNFNELRIMSGMGGLTFLTNFNYKTLNDSTVIKSIYLK